MCLGLDVTHASITQHPVDGYKFNVSANKIKKKYEKKQAYWVWTLWILIHTNYKL